jgi:aminoglycoside 3-N-acetyltransferase
MAEVVADIGRMSLGDTWMPTFNYEFCHGSDFQVTQTPSQVGVLSEFFRTTLSDWRTAVPVFSVAGLGQAPSLLTLPTSNGPIMVEPFGHSSIFEDLVRRGGAVLMLGCDLRFLTLAHYAEVAGGTCPPYRYEKDFAGVVELADGTKRSVVVRYHVTNLSNRVTYDWCAVQARMASAGVLEPIKRWGDGYRIDAGGFVDVWGDASLDNPLWALSGQSRAWVGPKLEALGRGFVISDFEPSPG